jgi:hypothetical protein
MKTLLLAILGLLLGLIAGGTIGAGVGLAWITLANTSCFEGYCGYLPFTTFAPIGAIAGAISGAVWLGLLGRRGTAAKNDRIA